MFPVDPDGFLGVPGENVNPAVFLDEPLDPGRLEHALNDPFVNPDQLTADERTLRRMAGWFSLVPDTDDPAPCGGTDHDRHPD